MPDRTSRLELLDYRPDLLPVVGAAYAEAVSGIPHCYPVDLRRLEAEMPAPAAGPEGRGDRELLDERVLLACEGGKVVGLLHLSVSEARPDEERRKRPPAVRPCTGLGVLRFFWYRRGHRRAGQALLDAAEESLAQHALSIPHVAVMHYDHTYPFYHVEHAYLSGYLDHVHALLGMNGYERNGSELVLDWPDFASAPVFGGLPAAPLDVTLHRQWIRGRAARPGLVLKARHRDREVGVCVCVSLGEAAAVPEAEDWLYTRWLGVEEDAQGRGLGRFLLLRSLAELAGVGYRHAAICTFGDNYRAFLLYSNLGYHVIDWTYTLRKDLP